MTGVALVHALMVTGETSLGRRLLDVVVGAVELVANKKKAVSKIENGPQEFWHHMPKRHGAGRTWQAAERDGGAASSAESPEGYFLELAHRDVLYITGDPELVDTSSFAVRPLTDETCLNMYFYVRKDPSRPELADFAKAVVRHARTNGFGQEPPSEP